MTSKSSVVRQGQPVAPDSAPAFSQPHHSSINPSAARCSGMLVMIQYDIEVGFAIGRLVSVFYEMAQQLTGSAEHVHFSFSKVGAARSSALPRQFEQVVAFDPRQPTPEQVTRLKNYIRDHRIDTLFALDLSANASYLGELRKAGIKRVFSYWGAPMSSINGEFRLLFKRLEVALLRRAKPDYFIFESRAMQSCAVLGRGIAQGRTLVIPTGVDADKFKRTPHHSGLAHERFGIPKHRRVIVYMGHLHQRKGVHVLMRAAVHVVQELRRDDIHVLFLGNVSDEVEQLRPHWNDAASHITFGGYQADIPALLSGCYAGCIPSTGWDSFPMSSLEMQACGLPVLTSDWQGVPETIVDRETGVVVPVGNAQRLAAAMAALVDDPTTRDRMALAARRRIEQGFTRQHQLNNLVACLSERL
ncbi:glycosyltransferase family 4 protein [Steroidobacter cummioxidans]|uniref:glycosyltransferase family 4 protein n=1 Tax=Steroidobacter cummioxidans TaxID=1803913 RepID=UPI000E30CDDB|nr:glycosyltransferase family 4 protein [Steroidobacter cummioxidans]